MKPNAHRRRSRLSRSVAAVLAAAGIASAAVTGLPCVVGVFPYTPPGQSVDTGTEIDARGDILTASHVLAGAATVTVEFFNGAVRTASVLRLKTAAT